MTGCKATINALGTWMVDLVGSVNGKDLPLAIRGTTQIMDFQRHSLSLHALKELGYNCAHVLTQNGNFLKITMEDIEYIFPLLTINGGDYVEIRIHRPLPASVAAYTVACLDLAKNIHPESLYSLLHLRYGCPGPKAMELIMKGERTRGERANVAIPELFRCPMGYWRTVHPSTNLSFRFGIGSNLLVLCLESCSNAMKISSKNRDKHL
jgi:hypothetical protein